MFSILQKSNVIKNQNKTKIIFIVGSIIYVIIHYIIFNECFDNYDLIHFIRPGFYIICVIDLVMFIRFMTEENKNKEIEKVNQEKVNVEMYYGEIIKQLSDNLQANMQQQEQVRETKPSTQEKEEQKETVENNNSTIQENTDIKNTVIKDS